jgi:hyperosmotically inducible periplasmic protein
MAQPLFEGGAGRRKRRGLGLAALALFLAVGFAVFAFADRAELRDISKALVSMRDSSIDAALAAKVRGALALSRRVSGLKVGVGVRSGVARLDGRVPTQEARSIVEAIATDTPGVKGVENGLVVDPLAAANGYEGTLLQRISDLETEVTLQERLRHEPLLAGANLSVHVEHGVVALRGWVEGDVERAGAQEIAQAAVGAEHVRNELQTLSSTPGKEDRLARRVEFELFSTDAFDLARVQVRSDAGRVRLEGSVRSKAERLLAARLTEAVPGVREVVNDLTLSEKS